MPGVVKQEAGETDVGQTMPMVWTILMAFFHIESLHDIVLVLPFRLVNITLFVIY